MGEAKSAEEEPLVAVDGEQNQNDGADNSDAADSKPEDSEVEVVLSAPDGSQPEAKRRSGFQRRIGRVVAQRNDANEGMATANENLAVEREKNRLLQLALEQQRKAPADLPAPPDPVNFDDGASDKKYVAALADYNLSFFAAEIQKHTEAQKPATPAPDHAFERAEQSHYAAADKIGVADFGEVEEVTIEILGQDAMRALVSGIPNSHFVTYYLGKNPDEAKEVRHLIDDGQAVAAIARLTLLGSRLTSQTKGKRNVAPDPDTTLKGGITATDGYSGTKGATFE